MIRNSLSRLLLSALSIRDGGNTPHRIRVSSKQRRRRSGPISLEQLEERTLLSVIFDDINPDSSDLGDADGTSGGRVNGLAIAAGTNNQTMYAASEFGGLFKSTDAGATWGRLDRHLPTRGRDVEVDPSNINKVYATSLYDGRVNSSSGILVSTDAGNTWVHPATATAPNTFNCSNSNNQPSAFDIAVRADASNNVFIGTNCGLARSTDSGATWTFIDPTQTAPGGTPFNPPVGARASNVWDVVVHDGGIIDVFTDEGHFRSTTGGNTWTGGTGGLPGGQGTIAVSPDEAYVLLVAEGGGQNLWESDDAGATWTNLGTPDKRRQGREMLVATNQRNDDGANNIFDVWFGDVGLFRARCTSQAAQGGANRCPVAQTGAAASPPPLNWNGPFTRPAGAHDDTGELLFDTTVTVEANPVLFSSDGGVHIRDGGSADSPNWTRSNVGLHATWLFSMAGADRAGTTEEDLYFGLQDDGSWGTRKAGQNPKPDDWHNEDCCDIFDMVADAEQVVYDTCCQVTPTGFVADLQIGGRDRLIGEPDIIEPPGGTPVSFSFDDVIDTFGTDQFVVATSTGVYFTNDIDDLGGASPWTQLDATNDPAAANGSGFVQAALSGGTPTFFVRSASQLWSFTGTDGTTANWTRLDNNPGGGAISFFAVDPSNPNRLYAARTGAAAPNRIIFSTDGGANWNPDPELDNVMTLGGFFRSFNPTLLAFDPNNPGLIVAGGLDSGVFLSTDSGGSWRLLTDPIDSGYSGVPHLPEPRFAYFDHEPVASSFIYVGTRGRGVWRLDATNLDLSPDEFEPNNTIATATVLGSLPKIIFRNLTIHTAADVDFFQYTAQDTGKVIVNLSDDFNGVLDVRVRDARGNILATGVQNDTTPGQNRQVLTIPVVGQERYYIEVYSSVGHTNNYDLEIENFAAPEPDLVDLDPIDDTGVSDTDDNTFDASPHIRIQADLFDFANEGVTILTAAQATAGVTPGAAVEVFVNGITQGFADVIAGTDNTLFEFTLEADSLNDRFAIFPPGTALVPGRGWLNFVTAAVRIFDGQANSTGTRTAASVADARSQLSEPLRLTFDPNVPAAPTTPDLLNSSDSGTSSTDNVTNVNRPAFQGTAEANTQIRIRANGVVVGEGVVGTDATDGVSGNGLGTWEVTVEPLIDATYSITAVAEDLAGNIGAANTALILVVDTIDPDLPYLDLVDASDSGRHNQDNVTNDNTPDVTTTANDDDRPQSPVIVPGNAAPHEICYRIFDRVTPAGEVLLVDSCATLGLSTAGFFTDTLAALVDGVHSLKLEVEDRAGNISHAFLLSVTIDTIAPPAPTIDIDPASSDTGVVGQPATIADNITSDTDTGFVGTAEANSIVRLFADATPISSGAINASDVAEGLTVAVPKDGNFAFPGGQWRHDVIIDLNDPGFFPLDGLREMGVTAEDLAGNVSDPTFQEIFIDTRGPQVTGVLFDPIDAALPEESVFGVKPLQTNGPTPLTRTIVINLRDLPARATGAGAVAGGPFLYGAVNAIVAVTPGQYVLTGDQNGVIAISSIVLINNATSDGNIATARVELNFNTPLPDDRYTLTVSDAIVDDAGNALDGESNTIEPTGTPVFPTGDGQPGIDFVARFTVDTRPEIGTFCCGSWYIDLNGNGSFDDPNNHDTDFTNGDVVYKFGMPGDMPVVGDWDGNGFDEIGVYGLRAGPAGTGFYFELDLNGNGAFDVGDAQFRFGNGGRPVAGNWNGVGEDHVAIFTGTTWLVDLSAAAYTPLTVVVPVTTIPTAARGRAFAADFNGDGDDDVGLFRNNTFTLDFATDDDFQVDTPIIFGFNSPIQLPVAADWDADRDGNIGLFVPDRNGMFPREAAEWYLDLGVPFTGPLGPPLAALFGGGAGSLTASPGDGLFQPPPTGGLPANPNLPHVFQDIFYQFGDELSEPVAGNFDPPPPGAPAPAPIVRAAVRMDHTNSPTAEATPVFVWDLGGEGMETGSIENSRDRDVFRFTPTESGRVAIDAIRSGSSLDTNLAVLNSALRIVARNNNFGGTTDSHAELDVVTGETYYIMVSSSRRTTGAYDVVVDQLLSGTWSDDHGNTILTATRLDLDNSGAQITGTIGQASDADYFVFTPSVSGRLEINAGALSRGLDTVLDVYSSSGRLLGTSNNAGTSTNDSRWTLDVIAGQRYSIRIRASGLRRGDYSLTLDYLLGVGL